ncbi:MAG: phenol hydroxylase [Erythrobacteraceae bacterium]|nr:phenol hydroxylase [Erythrobacteraceae bacterium]|tara:strand:+ start:723 stop:1082 length:360 start_codon:yes stop_codon:yes gene_type:complete
MPVNAVADYDFPANDREENFHGARVIYAGWDKHLMFSSPYAWPLPPDLPFAHFLAGPLAEAFGQHPDFAKIDWSQAIWTKNGEAFSPDLDKTIAENGLIHKDSLRFETPGLDGIGGQFI